MSGEQMAADAVAATEKHIADAGTPTDPDQIVADTLGEEQEEVSEESSEGTEAEAAASIDAAQKKGDITKQQANELKKRLKIKVDGVEEEVELDLSNDEALKRELQKSRAFDKRVKEFQSKAAQFEQIMELLQNDPESVLEKIGVDVNQLAEKRLEKQIEMMKKSPEELEREQMRKELEELKKEKQKAEEAKKQAELEALRNQQAQQIENDISEAMEAKNSILPRKNPKIYAKVAEAMLFAMKSGFDKVTAKDVIPLVEKEYKAELQELFNAIPEDTIEALVGQGNLDRLRKKRLAAQKAAKTLTAKQVVQDTGKTAPKEDSKKKAAPKAFNKFFSIHED